MKLLPLLLLLPLVSPVHGQIPQPLPDRSTEAVWPNLDNDCKPMLVRVSVIDMDTYPVYADNQIPQATRNRLRREARNAVEAINQHTPNALGGMDIEESLLMVNLVISLERKVFAIDVAYERKLHDPRLDRSVQAITWRMQTFGMSFSDVDAVMDNTMAYVKTFVSYYLAMNKCRIQGTQTAQPIPQPQQ